MKTRLKQLQRRYKPHGWKVKYIKYQNRFLFIDTVTGERTYTPPQLDRYHGVGSNLVKGVKRKWNKWIHGKYKKSKRVYMKNMPPGWQARYSKGRYFFLNKHDGRTYKEDPRDHLLGKEPWRLWDLPYGWTVYVDPETGKWLYFGPFHAPVRLSKSPSMAPLSGI
jgi:hypothetical protein